jgi:oxygen-independent coproporphyrinogen-3 oxidase
MSKAEAGIYIHIPFCISKCYYCDFISFSYKDNLVEQYIDALIKEIKSSHELDKVSIRSIFIGGGTPSIINDKYIKKILSMFKFDRTNTEISIEANPDSLNINKIAAYKSYGINRISIGLQSTNNSILKKIGRTHTYETFLIAYKTAKKFFSNINIDLIFGLPDQTLFDWKETLMLINKLLPTHISTYFLTIDKDNILNKYSLPNEIEEIEMYRSAKNILSQNYYKYEISNFAAKAYNKDSAYSYECLHNKNYWLLKDYIGFGLSAHSFFNGIRWHNTNNIKRYLHHPHQAREDITICSKKNLIEEFMFLGMRMINGVNKNDFESRFGVSINSIYDSTILLLKEEKLICENNGYIYLTDFGVEISNYVLAHFIL